MSVFDNMENEYDHSWGGITNDFEELEGTELKDEMLERIQYILTIEKEIEDTENLLSSLKSLLGSNRGGFELIMRKKKLNFPIILDNEFFFYDIDSAVMIKKIKKQV